MAAMSGGTARPNDRDLENLPALAEDAAKAAKRQLVSRRRDVELVLPQPTAADSVVAAIVAVVAPPEQIDCIQQLNSKKFFVSFKTAGSAEFFHRVIAPSLRIAGSVPTSRWLGAERKKIRVAFLPHAVPNSELADALKSYGRVVDITEEVYADTPVRIKTGTRVVEMEMTMPVPNIITVCGFTVPVTYKGVVLQCRRCLLTGHLKADCSTPLCDRCKAFGHCANVCKAPCLKCRAPDHHWRDCSVRSYAFAAASSGMSATPSLPSKPRDGADVKSPVEASSNPPRNLQNSSPILQQPMNEDTVTEEFNSATEINFESDTDVTCHGDLNSENRTADEMPHSRGEGDGQRVEEPTCSGPWESAKLRNKKRKNVSITPDKLPDCKKAAGGFT